MSRHARAHARTYILLLFFVSTTYLAFFGDEEISAFDVAVKDLLLVEVVQSIQELLL